MSGPPVDGTNLPPKVLPWEDIQQWVQGAVEKGQIHRNLFAYIESVVPQLLIQQLEITKYVEEGEYLEGTPTH